MKTYYIPVHFYEQDTENDDLVMFITQSDVGDAELESRLDCIKTQYMKQQDKYSDRNEIVDTIFNELADEMKGVWCYCETLPQLVIGDDE